MLYSVSHDESELLAAREVLGAQGIGITLDDESICYSCVTQGDLALVSANQDGVECPACSLVNWPTGSAVACFECGTSVPMPRYALVIERGSSLGETRCARCGACVAEVAPEDPTLSEDAAERASDLSSFLQRQEEETYEGHAYIVGGLA